MLKILDKQFKPYISSSEIDKRINALSKAINESFEGKNPIFIIILNGAFIFAADLLRKVKIDSESSFIKVKSYEGLSTSGKVTELIGLNSDIKDRNIVLVDDIIDTGITMSNLINNFKNQGPKSISTCTLLFKKDAFKGDFKIDFKGFEIDDKFVIGYGLDYEEKGRFLEDIYVLSED